MAELHSVVCVKVVPKSEEIRVDTETMLLVREEVRSEINPPDMNALEMAIALKDRHGGRVDILSMGPPSCEPILRVGLAMGADHLFLLSDRELGGADTLATTYTLAQGIRKVGGADLIFCGEESADGATGQVPAGLAEWLGIGQLTLLTKVDVDMELGISTGRREVKGGYEILEVPLPCVVSVKTACNEPRFMNFQRKPWAFESEETTTLWNAGDLGADPDYIGFPGSPTNVSRLTEAPTRRRRRKFLDGSPEEIAGQLAAILTDAL